MRPLLRIPTRLRLTTSLLVAVSVVGLMMAGSILPVAASEPIAEALRCDLDPRFGGSVANQVDHGLGFGITVDNPVIGPDGLTYASLSELILPHDHPSAGVRLRVIRFDADGRMDRAYGHNGFAQLPVSGYILSMALVDGGLLALTSEFGAEGDAAMVRLTGDGQLDPEFGTDGIVALGQWGRSMDGGLTGVVGITKTDVFSYESDSSFLTHFEVDHQGRIRENSVTEVRVGGLAAAYSDPGGRVLLMTYGSGDVVEGEEEPPVSRRRDLGNGATVITVSQPPLGRDEERVWLVGSHFDGLGRNLMSVDLDGNIVRSTVLDLGTSQQWTPIEAALTLPSGEILILMVDRSPESGPVGTIFRFPDFGSLSEGRFTSLVVDLNKPESHPPPTKLFLDAYGGAHIFSGSWGTSTGHVTRTRLLPHSVGVPQAGAMVDQMDRLYGAAFGREADTAGLGYWLDQRANGLSALSIAALFAQSPEFRSTYNDPDQAGFVEILYGNVLNRHSDAEGLAYWTGRLISGDLTRAQVLLAFSDSPEFVTKTHSLAPNEFPWSAVSRLYETAFARSSDHDGFCYFVAELQDGRSLSWVAQQMVQSAEFTNRHDGTNASFVSALYRGAFDRQPGGSELSYWVAQLEAGTARSAVLLQISASPEAVRGLLY